MPAVTVEERVAINGGSLTDNQTWYPRDIVVLGSCKFVPLTARDRLMLTFLGVRAPTAQYRLASDGFMEFLKSKRNQAVDEAMIAHIRQSDPMAQVCAITADVRKLYASSLPQYVEVPFPAMSHSGESSVAMSVRMVCDMCQQKCACVEITPEALQCVRMAALSYTVSGQTQRKKRRSPTERVSSVLSWVHADYRRETFWTMIVGEDGLARRVYKKPVDWDSDHDRDLAVDDLIAVARAEHHAMDGDGAMVLASRHQLDMFAPNAAPLPEPSPLTNDED